MEQLNKKYVNKFQYKLANLVRAPNVELFYYKKYIPSSRLFKNLSKNLLNDLRKLVSKKRLENTILFLLQTKVLHTWVYPKYCNTCSNQRIR